MFPTTYARTAPFSEPVSVSDKHTKPARSPSVGGIPSGQLDFQGLKFAILEVFPAGCLGPNLATLLLKL